jgi:hypothetical protein
MTGKGSNYLAAYRRGKRLTPGQSILAKCADCMADYVDGRESCVPTIENTCPLWPFMPYNENKQKKTDKKENK